MYEKGGDGMDDKLDVIIRLLMEIKNELHEMKAEIRDIHERLVLIEQERKGHEKELGYH